MASHFQHTGNVPCREEVCVKYEYTCRSSNNTYTINLRLGVQKHNIEFQIDQSHSANLSSLPNVIGHFIFRYCVLWTQT